MKIAIVGSGISGLTCAHLLRQHHEVTLFEAEGRPGGHAHTHEVDLGGHKVAADTGFLVYNERTYPLFIRLLDELGVPTQPSDMSFSVADAATGLEWCGSSPSQVFAQRRNLVNPRFLRMLIDVTRFNRLARRILKDPPGDDVTLAEMLGRSTWSQGFLDWYLIPLGSSIWSADPTTFTQIPAATFVKFFERHGLLNVRQQPRWRTITGGSARYVEALLAPLRTNDSLRLSSPVTEVRRQPDGVIITTATTTDSFDEVIFACHSNQALGLLADPTEAERDILSAIRYQPNRTTLHTDSRLLPQNRSAWASWNYHLDGAASKATLTYLLNRLQGFNDDPPLLVTLNQDDRIDPALIIESMDYEHPIFDPPAIAAQHRRAEVNAIARTWYCGAYWGYGFHEDGVRSAVEVCEALGVTW